MWAKPGGVYCDAEWMWQPKPRRREPHRRPLWSPPRKQANARRQEPHCRPRAVHSMWQGQTRQRNHHRRPHWPTPFYEQENTMTTRRDDPTSTTHVTETPHTHSPRYARHVDTPCQPHPHPGGETTPLRGRGKQDHEVARPPPPSSVDPPASRRRAAPCRWPRRLRTPRNGTPRRRDDHCRPRWSPPATSATNTS